MSVAVSEDMKETEDDAPVCTFYCMTFFAVIEQYLYNMAMLFPAVTPECSPSCGLNALCEVGACFCEPGYQGDGYNCSGECLLVDHVSLLCHE